MSNPRGLVAKVFPDYFNSAAFGSMTNCFTFMTGFDDNFMQSLGVKALRPPTSGMDQVGDERGVGREGHSLLFSELRNRTPDYLRYIRFLFMFPKLIENVLN